jgi:hypothetical protein
MQAVNAASQVRCCSSVVEHSLGKGEAASSILASSTIFKISLALIWEQESGRPPRFAHLKVPLYRSEEALVAFRFLGLGAEPFRAFYGLSDTELAQHGVQRLKVTAKPGFPDRVEVRDLEIGETALLLNYEHQPADTPYRSRHAIFVREGAEQALDLIDDIPEVIRIRPISLRAFDAEGHMLHADLSDGDALKPLIAQFFNDPDVSYLHAHYAKRGCYAAKIVRA